MIVYLFTNKSNGKRYVGQTCRDLPTRLREHSSTDSIFGRAIRKYGIDNFLVKTIEVFSMEEANELEEFLIQEAGSHISKHGYNVQLGGDNHKGWTHRQGARIKIGKASMGNTHALGHRHSEDALKKISNASKGNTHRKDSIPHNRRKVRCIETGEIFNTAYHAREGATGQFGPSHIGKVCTGNLKSAYGYTWEFVE